MNYLLVGVIVLWAWNAYRKMRSTRPTDVLPGSRAEAYKEILRKASELPKYDNTCRCVEHHRVNECDKQVVAEESNKGV